MEDGNARPLEKLESERSAANFVIRAGFALIAFQAVSGVTLLLLPGLGPAAMALLLGHALFGYLLAPWGGVMLARQRHYRRRIPSGRAVVAFRCVIITFTAMFLSGAALNVAGQGSRHWIWWVHVVSGGTYVASLCVYFVLTLSAIAGGLAEGRIRGFWRKVRTIAVRSVTAGAGLFMLFSAGALLVPSEPREAKVKAYERPFISKSLFFPSNVRTPARGFVKEEAFLGSRSCGTMRCHEGAYREWEGSTHRLTPNPFVVAAVGKLGEEAVKGLVLPASESERLEAIRRNSGGAAFSRLCAGCHAPVPLVAGKIRDGTGWDELAAIRPGTEKRDSREGISCKACHRMEDVPLASYGASSYLISPPPKVFFEESSSAVGRYLYESILLGRPDAHGRMYSNARMKDPMYCASCHRINQFEIWHESRYAASPRPEERKTCQDCHMASHEGGGRRDHRFLSAGFTSSDFFRQPEQFRLTLEFLRDRKIGLRILAPRIFARERDVTAVVRVSNLGVGHGFPSGPETDLTEAWLRLDVRDETGKLVASYGSEGKEGLVDARRTRVWRSYNLDGQGTKMENDRHRSWRYATETSDTLPPRTFEDVRVHFRIPRDAGQALRVEARLFYRKPNQAFADWVFGPGKYVVPVVTVAEASATMDGGSPVDAAWQQLALENDASSAEPGLARSTGPRILRRNNVSDVVMLEAARGLYEEGSRDEAELVLRVLVSNPTRLHENLLKQIRAMRDKKLK